MHRRQPLSCPMATPLTVQRTTRLLVMLHQGMLHQGMRPEVSRRRADHALIDRLSRGSPMPQGSVCRMLIGVLGVGALVDPRGALLKRRIPWADARTVSRARLA